MTKIDTFRALHGTGTFIMPNPWDRGSAKTLQDMGFPALATTSSGFGQAIGKHDHLVTRDELVAHVEDLTSFIDVPLNVDSERLYPGDPGGVAQAVRMLADAGASGCSIEDYDPNKKAIDPVEAATEAVAIAAQSCAEHGVVLTARCESHLYGDADLDDTISRLLAYRDAGAEVLYAPGLSSAADIRRVVDETGLPINVLALPNGPSVPELGELGVRRVSIGGSLFHVARRALRRGAKELLESGTSTYLLEE